MGLTDAIEYTELKLYTREIADNLGITDNIDYQLLQIIYREIADSMGMTDSIDYSLLQVILRTIADDMGLTDNLDSVQTKLPVIAIKPYFYAIFNPTPTGSAKETKPKIKQPYRRQE